MGILCERSPVAVRRVVRSWQAEGLSVGLVPTMGALHEGHLSLVRASAAECDRTVVSIFVNPKQFCPGEDLARYPRRLASDCRLLEGVGADMVFAPAEDDMYGPGFCTYVVQEGLADRLCGAFRPGHFRGVLTVVLKLFHIAPADRAYFGRKDFQQSVVIRRMVDDLNVPVEVRVLPTVREEDGLAISSRNEYLSREEREQAACLYQALRCAKELFRAGETSRERFVERMSEVISRFPLARVEYADVVDPATLEAAAEATEDSVAVLAVHLGQTRLIDNLPFGECQDIFVTRAS